VKRNRAAAAALAVLGEAKTSARIIAGGQSLGPMLNLRLVDNRRSGLSGWMGIKGAGGGSLDATESSLIRLTCYQVLQHVGDARAAEVRVGVGR